MKKSLRKVIVTLSAVAALSLAMGATAMADVQTGEIQEGNKATVTYTATGKESGEQVTVLLLNPDADAKDGIDADEIAYIDQKAAGTDGTVEFIMPITNVTEGSTYKLMSGSEKATSVENFDATFATEDAAIHYGDVTSDNKIGAPDSMQILLYTINKGLIVGNDELFLRADVTKDQKVGAPDSMQVLLYTINKGTIVSGGLDSWIPEV